MTDESATPSRAPARSELDLKIDAAWHRARFAEDPEISVRHWREHNALVAQRAAQQQGTAGL